MFVRKIFFKIFHENLSKKNHENTNIYALRRCKVERGSVRTLISEFPYFLFCFIRRQANLCVGKDFYRLCQFSTVHLSPHKKKKKEKRCKVAFQKGPRIKSCFDISFYFSFFLAFPFIVMIAADTLFLIINIKWVLYVLHLLRIFKLTHVHLHDMENPKSLSLNIHV